jgi:acetolactate synthase-1/2/3 large subunit
MGFALPAILGAHTAKSTKKIISIVGDGGFQLNMTDLHLIKTLNVDVVIILVNNSSLGNTRHPSLRSFSGRSHGNDIYNGYTCPNFEKLIKAFGLDYFLISEDSELSEKLSEIFSISTPRVLEVKISPDFYPAENW